MSEYPVIRTFTSASGVEHREGESVRLPEALAARYIAEGLVEIREAVDLKVKLARKAVRRGDRPGDH